MGFWVCLSTVKRMVERGGRRLSSLCRQRLDLCFCVVSNQVGTREKRGGCCCCCCCLEIENQLFLFFRPTLQISYVHCHCSWHVSAPSRFPRDLKSWTKPSLQCFPCVHFRITNTSIFWNDSLRLCQHTPFIHMKTFFFNHNYQTIFYPIYKKI